MIPKYRVYQTRTGKMVSGCCNYALGTDGLLYWMFGDTYRLIDNRDEHILMFSTGFKDKNSIEGFKDDIVKSQNGRLWQIKHGHYIWKIPNDELELYGFYFQSIDNKENCCFPIYDNFGEIIGNIHQHPKLLEPKEN